MFPYTAQCLVRPWINILRPSTENFTFFPFMPQTPIPMVQSAQQIMEIPQLLLIFVVDVPVGGSCRFSGAAVEKPLALPQLQLVDKSVTFFSVRVCLWSTRVWIFREMTPGMISVLTTPQFDNGYIFGVILRSLLEEFSSFFNAMLGSTVETSLRQTTEACFTGYDAPRAVFLCCPQAPDACHHGRYGPEGTLCVAVQKTADFPQLQFLAGRRHFLRCAEADFHGPCDHGDSPVMRGR